MRNELKDLSNNYCLTNYNCRRYHEVSRDCLESVPSVITICWYCGSVNRCTPLHFGGAHS